MKFVTLTSGEFEKFTSSHFSHYTQSRIHFENRNELKGDVHIVGVKDDSNNVIAATLMTEARALKVFKYFYTHRGPVMDYSNIELVHFFFKSLTRYLKKHNCLYVLVDPYILENLRNADGEILESYDNRAVIKTLEELGYKHQGWSVGYSTMSQIRWLSILDLKDKSEDQLLKEMDYQTRRNIKKTYEMGVKVRTLPMDETDTFFELFQMAEEKHGFKFRDKPYFYEMQKTYKDHAMLKLAYIDLKDYLSTLQEKHDTLTQQLADVDAVLKENPNSKKNKNKRTQIQQQVDSNERKLNETKDKIAQEGEILNLAAALYLYNDHEVYYLSSGSNPKYNAYMGAYRLQWDMIKFAKEHNVDRYNFYGITGDFSEDAEDFGVQQFKKGFNANVYEYIGDFIKPIKPFAYRVMQLLNRK
ncbi:MULTISPECIES: aminoacyltransferase [unclassified Staphylococcus]|uniref:aminoacyltransferase n=1 Tax=unclassified Staphylococcus TaxID=91994 RepID=UPI00187F9AFE|nr:MULTISPECIES: aminoacyltransferase [unclassified Staphylococcus]MBF2757480.1 aminoacyltransferase [Staphylococcus haemolyticus]MBF2774056.1 aminoacyltransferase [Staphylococcus haemolyticus]MBF2776022.1 aminoacyltransferase [Staphylococcus haemolyticus]MBF2815781.1 aminoacyltransferase [Staphylococcus haemolyticus]MBF9719498.1 aminoacyltransferase [Staphylococcus haemolyticus]